MTSNLITNIINTSTTGGEISLSSLSKKKICFSSSFFIKMILRGKSLNPLIGFARSYVLKQMIKFK